MGAARELWARNEDLARRCLDHPFVRGLGDGDLAEARYRRFIAQDAFFLDAFARAYALGVARAPDRRSMRDLHALLSGVFEEQRLHERVAAASGIDLGAVRPLPATAAYTDFLVAAAFRASLGELLAAMAPCMRLYRFLGEELARRPHGDAYGPWIATYAGTEYGELVATIEGLLDRHATGSAREGESYRRALELEHRFFEAAWGADER